MSSIPVNAFSAPHVRRVIQSKKRQELIEAGKAQPQTFSLVNPHQHEHEKEGIAIEHSGRAKAISGNPDLRTLYWNPDIEGEDFSRPREAMAIQHGSSYSQDNTLQESEQSSSRSQSLADKTGKPGGRASFQEKNSWGGSFRQYWQSGIVSKIRSSPNLQTQEEEKSEPESHREDNNEPDETTDWDVTVSKP